MKLIMCVRCGTEQEENCFLEIGPRGGLCRICATRIAMLVKTEGVDVGEPQASPKILGGRHYTQAQWNVLLDDTVDKIKQLAKQKGGEYSGDDDRLANFRRNGRALGLSMETVWAVYAGKHWDAIQQYIRDLIAGQMRIRAEPVEGRANDLIVYLLLFKAMCEERQPPNTNAQQLASLGATFPSSVESH